MRLRLVACMFTCALVAGGAFAANPAALSSIVRGGALETVHPGGAGTGAPSDCRTRNNDTIAKLEECIREDQLWHYLAPFQKIADENPDRMGHGNRNTGTRGYAASVAYVAKLMRKAGYSVKIQSYIWKKTEVIGKPDLSFAGRSYALEQDWFVARGSHAGTLTATVEPPSRSAGGCTASEFAGFTRGNIALLRSGDCAADTQVANAQAAGASAAILYSPDDAMYEARLVEPENIPVIGLAAHSVGMGLLREYLAGNAPNAHIDIRTQHLSGVDYNVIADSPYGDAKHTVVIDGHLDSIYGAGMLDNASGSATMLDIALNLAKTPMRDRLRYIWFGGEEIGLLGSKYYTKHLTPQQLEQTAFDVDVDVTATPNYDVLLATAAQAGNVSKFPPNVVPESKVGNDAFYEFFEKAGVVARAARFGNDGTDSNAFSRIGVPNTGILTQQDCCKHRWETKLWGGFLGNYEGLIPSHNGGCVDHPHRWCDNLDNNDPFMLELIGKSVAYVTFKLANMHWSMRS